MRKGYACLLVIEPNHAHARAMLDEELNARARRVGLWGARSVIPHMPRFWFTTVRERVQSLIRASRCSMPGTGVGVRYGKS